MPVVKIIVCVLTIALLAACGTTPATPTQSPADTRSLPTLAAPTYQPPTAPITRDTADRLALLGRLDPPPPLATVFSHAFTLDGTRLLALTNTALVGWDLVTGARVVDTSRYDAVAVYSAPDNSEIYLISRFADGLFAVVLNAAGSEQTTLRLHEQPGAWTYDPLTGRLAVGGEDGVIRVWDLPGRTALAALSAEGAVSPAARAITALAFLPGDQLVAADGEFVRRWEWRAREVNAVPLPLNAVGVLRLVVAPDGAAVAIGTERDARLWEPSPDAAVDRRLDTGGAADVIAFAPDSTRLVAGSGTGLAVWALPELDLIGRLPDAVGGRVDAAFGSDALLISTAFSATPTALISGVTLWDTERAAELTIPRGDLPVNTPITAAAWTPDQRLLALFSSTGPVYLWGIPPGA